MDMTKQEKNEQWREMNIRQKIGYLWDYEKWLFAIPILIVIAVYVSVTIYRNANTEVLLNVTVTDSPGELEELSKDFKKTIGKTADNQKVVIDTSVVTNDSVGMVSAATTMKLTTMIAANQMDVLLCSREIYEQFESQQAFADIREILGEQASQYDQWIKGDALVVDRAKINGRYQITPYEECYICVLTGTRERENAKKLIEYLVQ